MRGRELDIVIVDYDAGPLLGECLRSIAAHPPSFASLGRVVVVDNASRNMSRRYAEKVALPIQVIRNGENRGFAAACNQGARGSRADCILFLNPDTRLVEGSLDVPIRFLSAPENANVGIVGIRLLDDQGTVAPTCRRFPEPRHYWNRALGLDRISPVRFPAGGMEGWDHGEARPVDQLMGSFFLVRRAVFDALEGFDERFFVYYEEVDFSLRARRAEWESVFLPDACAFHSGCGTTHRVKARRNFYSWRSRILYAFKHFGAPSAASVLLVTVLVEPFSRLCFAVAKRAWEEAGQTARACGMLWSSLPGTMRCALRTSRRPAPSPHP